MRRASPCRGRYEPGTSCSCATRAFASFGAMVLRLAVLLALLLVLPASAGAAGITVDDAKVLHYTGTPGKKSNVRFTEISPGVVRVEQFPSSPADPADDDLDPGAGCTPGNPSTCSGVASAAFDAGDLSDRLEAGYLAVASDPATFAGLTSIPAIITGGDGNDVLSGGNRGDSI